MNVIEVFNDSYERCVLSEHFFERFYAKFWSKGKSFRQKFEGVDMQKQVRMLKGSIVFFYDDRHVFWCAKNDGKVWQKARYR